jgi:CheY-like chemotaxis protein
MAHRTFEDDEPRTGSHLRLQEANDERPKRAKVEVCLLFVDDDPLAEMTLRRALRRLEIESPLVIAHDGLEALELLRDPWFPIERTVILLDLNMPRMDGHEFLSELRSDPELARLPVVVMTTSDERSDVVRAYENGVAGYFLKPVSFLDFVAEVRAFVEYWSHSILPGARERPDSLPIMS